MSSDVELLPCPFCGSACHVGPSTAKPDLIAATCTGADCYFGPVARAVRGEDAIRMWNLRIGERANLAPLQAENERLRAEVERLRQDLFVAQECANVDAEVRISESEARAERLNQLLAAYQRTLNRIDDKIEYAIQMPAESRSALYAILSDLTEEVAAIDGGAK